MTRNAITTTTTSKIVKAFEENNNNKLNMQRTNKDFKVNIDELDESQKLAVECDSPNILIKASAGSGKTKTLITAVKQYRYENLNDRICAITFTRAAKAEMQARLEEDGVYDVQVATIHSWSRDMLMFFSRKYNFKLNILNEKEIKQILQDITKEYTKHSKIKNININILYTYIAGSKKMDITENYKRTLNALETRYIKFKQENVLYDFTDYPRYLLDVMEVYNETIDNIDALFVDEFQDVDTIQFEIFKRVNAAKKFFIGDSWQSIYIFREADGEVFNKLDEFAHFNLEYNYRSYQEIIDFATSVYRSLVNYIDESDSFFITSKICIDNVRPSDIKCSKGYGGYVYAINPYGEVITFHNGEKINATKHLDAMGCLKSFLSLASKPMILCRTNKQVSAIQEIGYLNVSTIHQAKGLEYDNVIVVDTPIVGGIEDLNVAYVALTRAKDNLMVINWSMLDSLLRKHFKISRW